jgi:hypothetical protein
MLYVYQRLNTKTGKIGKTLYATDKNGYPDKSFIVKGVKYKAVNFRVMRKEDEKKVIFI